MARATAALGASGHDGQRARLRSDLAARHRGIDVVRAAALDRLRERAGRLDGGGAHVDHQAVRRDAVRDAVLGADDSLHRRGVGRHHDHHGCALGHLARRVRGREPLDSERVDHRPAPVVDDDIGSGRVEVHGHRPAHQPEADEADDVSGQGIAHEVHLVRQVETVREYTGAGGRPEIGAGLEVRECARAPSDTASPLHLRGSGAESPPDCRRSTGPLRASAGQCTRAVHRRATRIRLPRGRSRMPRKTSKKFAAAFRASSATESPEPSAGPRRTAVPDTLVRIDLDLQRLELHVDGRVRRTWPVSTAANGPGELEGSECTPRGRHVIRAMIGAGAAPGAVFVARRPTGERYTPALGAAHPGRDWILTPTPVALGHRARPQPLGPRRHDAPLHLHPRLPGRRRHDGPGLPWLHPHAERRHHRSVRPGGGGHDGGDRDVEILNIPVRPAISYNMHLARVSSRARRGAGVAERG